MSPPGWSFLMRGAIVEADGAVVNRGLRPSSTDYLVGMCVATAPNVRLQFALAPLVLTVSAGIVACGGSPQEQAEQLRETAGSWAATLNLATEEWARGAVPSHFVESSATAAARELQRETRRVRSQAGAAASAPGDHVLARVPRLHDAVRRGDRSAALDIVHEIVGAVPPKSTPPVARPQ